MTYGLRNIETVASFTADELTVTLCREALSDGSHAWSLGFKSAGLPHYLDMPNEKSAEAAYCELTTAVNGDA